MTAELRRYEQNWRDRLAAALIGDARAGGSWGRFVESSVGSTGLGNSKMSLIDLSPLGMVLSGNEAVNAARDGNYGEAALDALGAVPGGAVTAGISKAGKAVKQAENIASRIIPVYDPPAKPPRPFELDYPNGAPADATGKLTRDIDGRPLTAEYIAGRRVDGGSDQALQSSEVRSVGEKGTGSDVAQVAPSALGRGTVGAVAVNRYTKQPEKIFLSDKLTTAQSERVLSHEVGHVIDQVAGEIPITGLSREMQSMYNTLNTGRERAKNLTRPEHLGYKGEEIRREYMADAIRAYMSDPNYIKTVSPKTAARIREYVNSNPKLKNIIQFNSLAAGGVGAAAMMPDDAKAQDMGNWWESAPLVENQQGGNGNWWESAPLVEGAQGRTLQDGSLNADNTVRALATGVPVAGGLLNRLNAVTNATLAPVIDPFLPDSFQKLPGETWEDRYNQALDIQQGKDKAFQQEHPYVNTGLNVVGGVAGTVPMVMAAPAAFGATGTLGQKTIASGLSGGVIGATDAGVRSDFDKDAMILGGGIGTVTGAAAPAIGQAVGSGVRRISNALANRSAAKSAGMTPSALNRLSRAIADDGLDASAVRSQLADLGPDGMIMDLGPNLQRQAGALAATPGRGQEIVRNAVASRNAGANQRVISGLDDALGPVTNPRAVNDAIRQGQRDLAPAYEEAFKKANPVDTSELASRLDTQASVRRGPGQKAAREIRNWLNVSSDGVLDTNPYTLFQTRNAIDGRLATEADPQAIALYSNARQQIDELLARNVPGIKMADAQYQELARQNEGLRTGVKALDSGREALRPDELRQAITDGVNPEGMMVGPSGNTFRMRQAARADIDRQVGTKANDVVALKNVLKGEGDWNRDRIGMLFGPDRAERALSLLDREARFADTSHIVTRNSETAARNAAMQELGENAAPKFGTREGFMAGGVTGAARSSAVRAVEKVAEALMKNGSGARNASLAEAISSNRSAVVDAISKVQQRTPMNTTQIDRLARALLLNGGLTAVR